MKSGKCRPSKSPYHKNDFKICKKTISYDPLFMENVNDIADTMSEIMIICGIHRCKAKCSRATIVQAFQFYDTQRHRFEDKDQCGICRDNIVADFERKSFMNRLEALLAYSIVKRAVKAFYYGTSEHSLRSPVMEAVILKEQQFVWQHAAKKTIQIFESFKHAFFNAQSNYNTQIVNIYNELYGRLKSRADPVIVDQQHPRGCVQKIIIGTKSPPKLDSENKYKCVKKGVPKSDILKEFIKNLSIKKFPIKSCSTLANPCPLVCDTETTPQPSADSFAENMKKKRKNVDLNLPRCYQCDCPRIICDCDIDPDTGVVAIDCSQGPFECQWVHMSKREKPDPCIEKRELHQCPVDCSPSEISTESDECECCSGGSSSEEYTESEEDAEEEEEFEKSDNEDVLTGMMLQDLPKLGKNYNYQLRRISKVPPNHTRARLETIKEC